MIKIPSTVYSLFLILFFLLVHTGSLLAQLTVVQGVSMNLTPVQLVQDYLVGQGISVMNVKVNGSTGIISTNQVGHFQTTGNAALQLKIDAGVLMTNGAAAVAIGPNNLDNAGVQTGTGADPDLDILMGSPSLDKCVLEFDFVPQCDTITFRYVFGSEEFYEFCGESINDGFGFFLSGPGISGTFSNNSINLALMPGSSNFVQISNICLDTTSNWDNSGGVFFQYDGITHLFTAWHLVQPGLTYHIKLAIADAHDQTHDSGVFLEKNSFSSGVSLQVNNWSTNPAAGPNAIEGCNDHILSFKLGHPVTQEYTINFTIGGTALNGTDYTQIPAFVKIPAGQDSASIIIHPILDGITEGPETFALGVNLASCTGSVTINDTILIEDNFMMTLSAGNDVSMCAGDTAKLVATVTGGLPPYSFEWNVYPGKDSVIYVSPPAGNNPYYIRVNDKCGLDLYDTVQVTVNQTPALTNDLLEKSICNGDSTHILLTANISAPQFSWSPTLVSGSVSGFYAGTGETINQFLVNDQTAPGEVKYHVMVTGNGCDTSWSDFRVTVNSIPVIDLVDSLFLATGAMITLHAGPGYSSYLWSTGSSDSLITVDSGGHYWVKVENIYSCSNSDTIFVREVGLLVPNAFTPNGDGLNDLFTVKGLDTGLQFQMQIYNRWGTIVFESNTIDNGWDGTTNNQPVPEGVYTWIIHLSSSLEGNKFNKTKTFTGNLTVIR